MSDVTLWMIAAVAFAFGAFYSGTETALIAANRIRLRGMSRDGNKRAQMVLDFVEDSKYMLSAVLVGTNLAVTACSSTVTALATRHYGEQGAAVATIALVPLFLVFNEIIPKGVFLYYSNRAAIAAIVPIRWLSRILHPVILFFSSVSSALTRRMPSSPGSSYGVKGEELLFHIDDSHEAGLIADETIRLLERAVGLKQLTARDVMKSLDDVAMISFDESVDRYTTTFIQTGYSRMPVFTGDRSNIVGVLSVHDLMRMRDPESLREQLPRPYTISMSTPIVDVLFEMREKGRHMAMVVDNDGAMVGMTTMEDILERFVGAISDEFNYHADHPDRK